MAKKAKKAGQVAKIEKHIDKAKRDSKKVNLVDCERELRKFVKRTGGFRRDVTPEGERRAKEMLKKLDRSELVWDKELIQFS